MFKFKVYLTFWSDNEDKTASRIGKYIYVSAEDILTAIQKVYNDPKYNKFNKAEIKSVKQVIEKEKGVNV